MYRLGISGSCLALIVSFVVILSGSVGSNVPTGIKRNIHPREFHYEDDDLQPKEIIHQRQVQDHHLDEWTVDEVHNNVKRSQASAVQYNGKEGHRSTREVASSSHHMNRVVFPGHSDNVEPIPTINVNINLPAHLKGSNVMDDTEDAHHRDHSIDSAGTGPTHAPWNGHEADFFPYDHDDDDSAHHDHHQNTPNTMPEFEGSDSAVHQIVQIHDQQQHHETTEDEHGDHYSTNTQTGPEMRTKRSTVANEKLIKFLKGRIQRQMAYGNGDALSEYFGQELHYPRSFCLLERDGGNVCPGLGRELFLKQYYYDSEKNQCLHFLYSGCGGNANRFSSSKECSQSCVYPILEK